MWEDLTGSWLESSGVFLQPQHCRQTQAGVRREQTQLMGRKEGVSLLTTDHLWWLRARREQGFLLNGKKAKAEQGYTERFHLLPVLIHRR